MMDGFLLFGIVACLAIGAWAGTVELPPLPSADRLDTEVTLDWPFNRVRQDVNDFNFDLAFVGTWEDVPDWVYDPTWNLMRLTARGLDDSGALFEVQVDYRALHIFLR